MSEDNEYYYWDRGENRKIGHFELQEFVCKCSHASCLKQRIGKTLIAKLNLVRDGLGAAVRINSGYRCAEHQEDLKKAGYETAKGISQHQLGNAADIAAQDMHALLGLANSNFDATGAANTFIHVDLRNDQIRRWSYQRM